MNSFAETLSEKERRRARIYAYFSAYFGCISEVMLDSSAIIILYIGMLGGGSMLVMLSTSFSGIFGVFLMIPFAALIGRIGAKRAVSTACITGCAGFLLMAAAPLFGPWQKIVVLLGCIIYCAQRSLYGAAWYPMLDVFLRPQDRGRFFGTLRYTYMIVTGILLFLLGKLMGKNPPVLMMQIIIGITGLLLLGRMFCMLHFPENRNRKPEGLDIRRSLMISIRNGPLVCYAVYACLFSIAYTSLVPLTLVYLKQHIGLPPGTVQIFSTAGIAGSITGFLLYGFLLDKLKIKRMELLAHGIILLASFALFLIPQEIPHFIWIIGSVYFMAAFASATFMCNNSSELLALARPGNKPMAMAFLQTYQNIGIAAGRTGTALILGASLLAPAWTFGNLTICHYQTLFLIYGVIAAVLLLLFPMLPAIVPKHHDYYDPVK